MRLSETEVGRGWLANFKPSDVSTAQLLLDSLRVVTYAELRAGLAKVLSEVANQHVGHVALYPARRPRRIIGPQAVGEYEFIPEPDIDRPMTGTDGSELVVAEIIRDVRTHLRRENSISNYQPLSYLRRSHCRAIFIVDDYSGSGDTAVACVDAWRANPTIRSWVSFGWTSIHYVSFAASSFAEFRVMMSLPGRCSTVAAVEPGRDFATADWTSQQRHQISQLVRDYTHRPSNALGWNDSAGLMLFAHASPPNNLPAVFTQKRGPHGRRWVPLVERTRDAFRPQVLLDQSFVPPFSPSRAAQSVGQRRLAEAIEDQESPLDRQLIVVLGALVRRKASVESLAQLLRTTRWRTRQIVEDGVAKGLISQSALRLTDSGWEELRNARRLRRNPRSWSANLQLAQDEACYYPSHLRRGTDV